MGDIIKSFGKIIIYSAIIVTSSPSEAGDNIASQILFGPSHKQLVAKAAAELNKQLPKMIDRETRLDSVDARADGGLFTYNYTLVNYNAKSISAAALISIENAVVNTTCSEQDSNLLKKNVALEFRYRSADGYLVKAFTVPPKSCIYDLQTNRYGIAK
jgi:hypothetical protein